MLLMWELTESDLCTLPVTDCSSLLKTETPQIATDVRLTIVIAGIIVIIFIIIITIKVAYQLNFVDFHKLHIDFLLINAHLN